MGGADRPTRSAALLRLRVCDVTAISVVQRAQPQTATVVVVTTVTRATLLQLQEDAKEG